MGGAKIDFAAAAMLGKQAIVEAMLAKNPALAKSRLKSNDHKLVLDVDSGNGTMFLAIATATGKKWLPGGFTHSQFAGLHDVKALKPLVDKFEEIESEAESQELTERFLAAAVAGLAAANVKLLERASGFEMLVLDHDEPVATARKRASK